MTQSRTTVVLERVDLTHGQVEPDEANDAFAAEHRVSRWNRAAHVLADDVVCDYRLSAGPLPQRGAPKGEYFHVRWVSRTVCPGVARSVYPYLTHGAAYAGAVDLLVCQDGPDYVGPQVLANTVLDNLVHNGELPMTASLFVCPGASRPSHPYFGGDYNRSKYDTVSGDYAGHPHRCRFTTQRWVRNNLICA